VKRLLKSWVFWAFVAPPLGLALAFFVGSVRRLEICPECASTRVVRFWYVGFGGSRARVTPESVALTESHVLHDFLPEDHAHRWASRQTTTGNWLITTCGVGAASSANDVCESYEVSAEFREFVRKKLAKGDVDRSELLDVLQLPRHLSEAQSADLKSHRSRALGESWLEEFSK